MANHVHILVTPGDDREDFSVIRDAIQGGWVVGSESFKRKIARRLQRQTASSPRGGDRRSEKFRAQVKGA